MEAKEKIFQIEKQIRETPYHKGTEHHIGRLRAKLAKLKEEVWFSGTRKSGARSGYAIKKSGDAVVVIVGPPSVGKSSLLNSLTEAQSKVADYDFTTLSVIPGMMNYQGARILFFDIPGIIEGAAQGKGRGKEVLSVVRNADLILIIVDLKTVNLIEKIKKELYQFGLRLDEELPQVSIKKTVRGGIKIIATTPLSHLSLETIKNIAAEFKIGNAEITIKENISTERLIDVFMGNRIYLPYLVAVNKIDLLLKNKTPRISEPSPAYISVQAGKGLEDLKKEIWKKLGLVRVFLKARSKKADLEEPLIIKQGWNLRQILIDLSFPEKEEITRAKIFGPGAKFPGQEVSLNFQPQEGTIINFLG